MKKKFLNSMVSLLALILVGCNSSTSKIDLTNLTDVDDVNNAYKQNWDKIKNQEYSQDLDITSFNQILDYAQKAKDFTYKNSDSTDKIEFINKLVILNDLYANTDENLRNQTLEYLISDYKNGNIEKDLEKKYYLIHYLANGVNSKDDTYNIIIAMNSYLENIIKLEDSKNNKDTIEKLIKDNKDKINQLIYTTTEMYDSEGNNISE